LNDGNLSIDRSLKDYKGFLAREIVQLQREWRIALEILASSGNKRLIKLYKKKVQDLEHESSFADRNGNGNRHV
jgi:hypothetical protein